MREAIVLAGGFGTRLREVVPDWPKPMAPVAGRHFLEIVLSSLASQGFSRVVFSLGFMADKISNHFGSKSDGMDLVYVVEDQPLGTGGAVRLAMTECTQDHVFVLNGDTFLDFDAATIDECWLTRRNPIIVACQVPDAARYGCMIVRNGLVKGFTEKGVPGPGLINAGCYVFHTSQLNQFALNQRFSLETDFLANAIHAMPVDAFINHGDFIDIGVPEDYRRAQIVLADR